MNIKINKNLFLKYLKFSNNIIVENQINPILSCVLIKFKKDVIEFICLSNNVNGKFTLKNEFEIDEEFEILIKAKILMNIISKIKDNEINIIKNADNNLIIKSSNFECELNSLDSESFPKVNFSINDYQEIKIKAGILKTILSKTLFLANANDINKIISGVYFKYNKQENKMHCLSTDSFRVSKCEYILENVSNNNFEFIINGKTLEKISSFIFLDLDDQQEICFQKTLKGIFMSVGDKLIELKLMEGNFPNVSDVFKLPSNVSFSINKDELTSAVDKALSIVSLEKTHSIKIEITNKTLEIEAKSYELGYCRESISLTNFQGDNIVFKINGLFLLQLLKNFNNEEVHFSLTSNSKPIILKDLKDNTFEQLILPIRI